jgi:HK97 family phage major capsid protein
MHNVHELPNDLQSIVDAQVDYYSSRLHEFQRRRERIQAAGDRKLPPSLARAVQRMMEPDGTMDGADREFFQETARYAGKAFDPQRICVPFEIFRRDLTAANAGAGGYLLGVDPYAAQDMLRPWSTVLRAGVTVEDHLQGNVTVARTTAKTTIVWQTNEASQATPSQPTLAQAALTPKTAIGVIQASRNFMTQADPERWIRRELLRTCGTVVDQAVLNGSGAAGQPTGILNTVGLGTQTGTSLAWAGVLSMKRKAADANVQDGAVSFIGTTAVRELLEGRERATGGGSFIWQDDKIASCPANATTDMLTATLLSGPMSEVLFGIWGGGFAVEINPFDTTLFKAGIVQVRVVLSCDVAILCAPAAFTAATSIT